MSGVHRRKSSKDEAEDDVVLAPSPPVDSTKRSVNGARDGHHRTRSISTPESDVPSLPQAPPSFPPGPYRPALNIPRANGLRPTHQPASSPLRASFSAPTHLAIHDHARTRSVSGPYQPSLPSPLSASFPPNHLPFSNTSASFPPSSSAPEALPRPGANANANGHPRTASFPPIAHDTPSNASNPPSNRRHARLHSRNLSVFFPRPGSLPHTTISEDGSQEIEAPTTLIPPASTSASASSPRTKLGEGFTFGSRPPPDAALGSPTLEMARTPSARRGHHHKHSLSHNFFSFLEPGSSPAPQQQAHPVPAHLHTQPTPNPAALWTSDSHGSSVGDAHEHGRRPTPPSDASPISASPSGTAPFGFERDPGRMPPEAAVAATGQFALGALLWVAGQQAGSLACTGLGYWVVFDALGVGVSRLLPAYLRRPSMQQPLRRPYGNGRVETVVLFAQAVYLMFSAVYVFKEAVEHLLLSAGEGHHHHPGDEDIELLGIEFPLALLFLAFFSLLGTALAFDNHGKLMNGRNSGRWTCCWRRRRRRGCSRSRTRRAWRSGRCCCRRRRSGGCRTGGWRASCGRCARSVPRTGFFGLGPDADMCTDTDRAAPAGAAPAAAAHLAADADGTRAEGGRGAAAGGVARAAGGEEAGGRGGVAADAVGVGAVRALAGGRGQGGEGVDHGGRGEGVDTHSVSRSRAGCE